MSFRRAQRKKARLRLGLCGPSGSGKSYSSIQVAMGLGGSIAMIDTENGSGELYAHLTDYDIDQLEPPFHPDRYVEKIQEAEAEGYDIVIIDSLSHAWTGPGGLLEVVDNLKKNSRHGMDPWRVATPIQENMIQAILRSRCHIIATMRTRTAWDFVEEKRNNRTVKKPVKVGLAPEQRQNIEYEFTAIFDLSVDGHVATPSKHRMGSLLEGLCEVPSPALGEKLLEWLETGEDPDEVLLREASEEIEAVESEEELKALWTIKARRWQLSPRFPEISALVSSRTARLQETQEATA